MPPEAVALPARPSFLRRLPRPRLSHLRLGGQIVWRAIVQFIDDDGPVLSGHIAFVTFFSLFPFLLFLTTLASEIGQATAAQEFVDFVLSGLPAEVSAVIEPVIDEVLARPRTRLLTLSIVLGLWAGSSAIEALRTALNHAYGIAEPRPFWWCRLQSAVLTLLFSVSVIVLMTVVVAAPFLWSYVVQLFDVPWFWSWLYQALRHLFAVTLLYLVVVLLYRWLPNRHLRRREILPGALVTVVLWLGLASLFSLYLQHLGRFSITYGSLGGVIVTLVFFYLSASILIFGAELNSARRRTLAAALRAARAARQQRASPAAPSG